MQPITKGDKIFANIDNATVYRSTDSADAFAFLGIEPKKPLFVKNEQIGVFDGTRFSSRDLTWYGITWTHKYKRISLGGTRLFPVIQYTDYTETRQGYVRSTDIYAEAVPVADPASPASPPNNTSGNSNTEDESKKDSAEAPKEVLASTEQPQATTNKTLTTLLYVSLSVVVTIFLMILFRKPQNQQ